MPDVRYSGFIDFIEQELPDCPNANNNLCDEHGVEVPDVNTQVVAPDPIYSNVNICADQGKLAGTIPANGKELMGNYNVFACFDLERQKWQFKVDNENTLFARVVVEICDNNIANNFQMILVDSLDDVPDTYPCTNLVNDVYRFYTYGATKSGAYIFRKLLLQHELLHNEACQNGLDQFRTDYEKLYKDEIDNYSCSDFNNPEEAETVVKKQIRNIVSRYAATAVLNDKIFNFNPKWPASYRERLESNLHRRMYGAITSWWIAALDICSNP